MVTTKEKKSDGGPSCKRGGGRLWEAEKRKIRSPEKCCPPDGEMRVGGVHSGGTSFVRKNMMER